jgi:photosystem II stability/assembly factor-like uncharacterized protein
VTARAGFQPLPPVTRYDSLLVSQADPNTIFLGTQRGLFLSVDGGKRWKPDGLRGEPVTSLSQVGSSMLAAGKGLLAESADGGKVWRRLKPQGLPNEQIDALTAGSGGSSTVYVVIAPGGLYRSSDGARSFEPVWPLVGPAIKALALTPQHIIAGDVVGGVFVSANGQKWAHTAGGMVMALAVNRHDEKYLLAASYGVALSRDGGRFWTTMMHSKSMFGAVAWAPSDPSLAYAVGDNRSFWRSTDGGVHWRERS